MDRPPAGGFLGLTALWAEGYSIAFGHALSGVRVQRVQKVQKVQRVVVSPLWGDEFYCRLSAAGVTEFSRRSSVILSEAKDLGTWCT